MIKEELIESLTLLQKQARKSGDNTFIRSINIDSFNYVIDHTIKAIQQESIVSNNELDFYQINDIADFAIEATGQRDSYSRGMCNGIEYLRAVLTGTNPKYF